MYCEINDENPTLKKNVTYGPYETYELAHEDTINRIQYRGMLINHAWYIYSLKDGKLTKIIKDN